MLVHASFKIITFKLNFCRNVFKTSIFGLFNGMDMYTLCMIQRAYNSG